MTEIFVVGFEYLTAMFKVLIHATCFHAGISLGIFYPEDGGDMFFRNDS
jgi:hypothetical protein